MKRAIPLLALLALPLGCGDQAPKPGPIVTPAQAAPKALGTPAVRVRVQPAARGPFTEPLRWTGFVLSESKVRVGAEVPGRVAKRVVDRGQAVEKGEVLLRLSARKQQLALNAAKIQRESAEHSLANAQREYERGQKLGKNISSASLDQLRDAAQRARDAVALAKASEANALNALGDTSVRAPFTGVIADRFVDVGDMVAPGTPLFTLVSVDPMLVRVGVTAASTARLKPGLEAAVLITDLGGERRTGTLEHVARVPDPKTGTYAVDFKVPNPEDRLREGMAAEVVVEPEGGEALLVPREALVESAAGPAVYVAVGEGDQAVAKLRPLRLGRSSATRAEVIDGLKPGERVVVAGQFALADGARVQIEAD